MFLLYRQYQTRTPIAWMLWQMRDVGTTVSVLINRVAASKALAAGMPTQISA